MIRALAWGLWLAIVGSFLGAVLSGAADEDGEGSAVAYTVFIVAFATMGALVASRQPRNPIGWILLSAGLAYAVGGLTVSMAGEAGPSSPLVTWVSTWVWLAGVGPVATFGLLLFPDGKLPSRRWRSLAWLAAAANGLVVAGIAFAPGRFEDTRIENPLGLSAAPGLPDAMAAAGGVALAIAIVGSIASLFVRFRRARSVERQQLKWLTYTAVLVGIALAVAAVIEAAVGARASNLTNSIVTLSLAAVPIAMGTAILRHRLYDIDVVINRTLVYGALTATLAGAYLALVLLIGFAVGKSDLAIADLRGVVRDTVQPAHVSLWLRGDR